MELGHRLKQARLEAGLSQRQLCGQEITRNMLSQIENGSAHPSMKTLQYLASRLGKPVSDFLREEETPLDRGRGAYAQGRYAEALELARSAQGDEAALLEALCDLALARQALAARRRPYARQLLEDMARAGARTAYYTPELERGRLLELARTEPDNAGAIAAALPDEELLLRARLALDGGEAEKALVLLSCAGDRESSRWSMLGADSLFALGRYREAMELYKRQEEQCLRQLEECCQRLEDYKTAYYYACRQRKT